nr:MAG TPA: hypothetical protein [Caudoviricetes sp.]
MKMDSLLDTKTSENSLYIILLKLLIVVDFC